MTRHALAAITTVVPARDEEELLPACLEAVAAAAATLAGSRPEVVIRTIVVLDSCTDRSADVVRAHAAGHHGLQALEVRAGSAGAARALGARAALDRHAGPHGSLWIACTDADTVVPPHWLVSHAVAADAGLDVLVGTVEPDAHLDPALREEWERRHDLGEDHAHVHGANLGLRGSVYDLAGGFAALEVHEDAELVARLRALPGVRLRATDEHRVVTSSRHDGRVPGGFSGYLRDLAAEV